MTFSVNTLVPGLGGLLFPDKTFFKNTKFVKRKVTAKGVETKVKFKREMKPKL